MSAAIRWEPYDGGGMNVGVSVDPVTGDATVVYNQPMDRIKRDNHFRQRNEDNSARRRAGVLYQIAEIPLGMIQLWKILHGVDIHDRDHFPAVLQLIQSQEYAPTVMVVDDGMKFCSKPKRDYFIGPRDSRVHSLGSRRAKQTGMAIAGGTY